MKRLLFMVIVTIVVLGSFARPEKESDTSVSPTPANNNIKNTANHTNTAGNSAAQYKKG